MTVECHEYGTILRPRGNSVSQSQADHPILRAGARELGLALTDAQIERFDRYQAELIDWNQRMNLTAIVAAEEIEIRHFLDSLTVVEALPEDVRAGRATAKLIDVGAGAGFPGVPLAIVCPNLRVTLVEATQKKCRFLDHLQMALGLSNTSIRCGRSEDLARQADLREAYDLAVARALAPLSVLTELCLPFLRLGGRLIALKKRGIEEEVSAASRAIKLLGGQLEPPILVRVPILNEDRQLIIIHKARPTPATYPRRPGTPGKSPL